MRALRDASLDIGRGVKVASLKPQHFRLFDMSRIVLENGQAANRICQIELRRMFMLAVKVEGLVIAAFRERPIALMAMDISNVPDGMRNSERIALRAINGYSFFIIAESCLVIVQVPFDLTEGRKRSCEFDTDVGFVTQVDGLDEVAPGVLQSFVFACLMCLLKEVFDGMRHSPDRLSRVKGRLRREIRRRGVELREDVVREIGVHCRW